MGYPKVRRDYDAGLDWLIVPVDGCESPSGPRRAAAMKCCVTTPRIRWVVSGSVNGSHE